jgi:hypothetical protein
MFVLTRRTTSSADAFAGSEGPKSLRVKGAGMEHPAAVSSARVADQADKQRRTLSSRGAVVALEASRVESRSIAGFPVRVRTQLLRLRHQAGFEFLLQGRNLGFRKLLISHFEGAFPLHAS